MPWPRPAPASVRPAGSKRRVRCCGWWMRRLPAKTTRVMASRNAAMKKTGAPKRILCIDVGGTGLKAAVISPEGKYLVKRVRVRTPERRKPKHIVKALAELAAPLGAFDHVTIGFPGVVKKGVVLSAPSFGTEDWKGFALAEAMRKKF